MNDKVNANFLNKFRQVEWELRVRRPGFLQSQFLASQALMKPLPIAKGVTLKYRHMLWINDAALYDGGATRSFTLQFQKAFAKNPRWPKKIISILSDCEKEVADWTRQISTVLPRSTPRQRLNLFKKYVQLHLHVHWCYVAAVPLTNYCEQELAKTSPALIAQARTWKKLDIDKLNNSLRKIKQAKYHDQHIRKHLQKYAWIKTAYNIVGAYTEKDVREELLHVPPDSRSRLSCRARNPLLDGLEIGMYARNRMKELSQKIWYTVEGLAQAAARELHISRDDFFLLLPNEAERSMRLGRLSVSKLTLMQRKKSYAAGYMGKKAVLVTGSTAALLSRQLTRRREGNASLIQGNTACRGTAKGTVRIITSQKQFGLFQQGDILVATMTTPDFIVIMKKAAAIVTDEGGLSCHAAIVSRELGIPCVIGTKIATQTLADGDRVEVNATAGTVTKL